MPEVDFARKTQRFVDLSRHIRLRDVNRAVTDFASFVEAACRILGVT